MACNLAPRAFACNLWGVYETRSRRRPPWWLVLGVAWVLGAAVGGHYLRRGWVPHDAGSLAQSAERVLAGELPHRDFDDIYTGGLSFLHALAFRLFGTTLLSLRLVLLMAFLAWLPAVYYVAARRSSRGDRLLGAGGGAGRVARVAAVVRARRIERRPLRAPRAADASLRPRRGGADPRVPRAVCALGLARRAVGRGLHRAGEALPLRDDGFSRVVDDARGARPGGAAVARPTLAAAVATAGGARAGAGPP